MQKNYQIVEVYRFSNVTFYSVKLENENISLFQNFIQQNNKKSPSEVERVKQHIQFIGMFGAKMERFRPEKKAHAIPTFETKNHLRLYSLRLTDEIVILYSGDFKTAKKAQDCPNVFPHFQLANSISEKILKALKNKTITIDFINNSLIYQKDFIIEI